MARPAVLEGVAGGPAGADAGDEGEDQVLGGDARRERARRTRPRTPSACAAAGTGSPARGRPRSCRCRRRAPRRPRGCWCGCRRRRSVEPGWVRPSSGPITWTMPWRVVAHRVERDPELPAVALEGARPARPPPPRPAARRPSGPDRVGIAWSIVATVRSGRRTRRPRARSSREGLRRGDLVDEVQVDVEDGRRLRASPPTPGARPRSCRGASAAVAPWRGSGRGARFARGGHRREVGLERGLDGVGARRLARATRCRRARTRTVTSASASLPAVTARVCISSSCSSKPRAASAALSAASSGPLPTAEAERR